MLGHPRLQQITSKVHSFTHRRPVLSDWIKPHGEPNDDLNKSTRTVRNLSRPLV